MGKKLMRPLERVNLIKEIAFTLQEQMTYSEIDMFLPFFGISCKNYQPSSNSKRVYVQELLADEKDDVITNIADELEIGYSHKSLKTQKTTFWQQGYFKLFISHLAKHKEKAVHIKDALKIYGISSFIAHKDVKPSREWQVEIEKALHTMDALTAILMDGFKESKWCDQEVGFAVGKEVLIIPVKKDLDPYGFIAKYQFINGDGKSVGDVAKEIFNTIVNHDKTRDMILTSLTNIISNSTHEQTAKKQLYILSEINDIPKEILIQMSEQIKNNTVLMKSKPFILEAKKLFSLYGITDFDESKNIIPNIEEDEIPF